MTKEELKEKLYNWMIDMGEDYIDYNESLISGISLATFCAGLRTENAPLIWENIEINNEIYEYSSQDLQELYNSIYGNDDLFYDDLCNYIVSTQYTLKKVLKSLEDENI